MEKVLIWITGLSLISAVLLLGSWVALFFGGRFGTLFGRAFLTGGGLGLAVLMGHILIAEPLERKERQLGMNRMLFQERLDIALERIDCPSGQILVVVPGTHDTHPWQVSPKGRANAIVTRLGPGAVPSKLTLAIYFYSP